MPDKAGVPRVHGWLGALGGAWTRREFLGWLPLVVAALGILLVLRLSTEAVFEPPYLLPFLNIVFLTGISLLVAWLAARSYLSTGFPSVLLLGAGMLAFGIGSGIAAGGVAADLGPNVITTGHNMGAFLAALFCLGSVITAGMPGVSPRHGASAAWTCVAAYAVPTALMALAGVGAVLGLLPKFFDAEGHTDLRQFVLLSSVGMFAVAFVMFRVFYQRSSHPFLHWYSIGIGLIAVGVAGVLLQRAVGDPVSWAGRVSQYTGCVYLFVAVRSAGREAGTWGIPLEQALRELHDRYRRLVDMSPDAILVHSGGRYVFANPAAARLFGALDPSAIVGKEVLDYVAPGSRGAVALRIAEARAGHTTPATELQILTLDGRAVDVEAMGVPVEFQGRGAVQIVLRDVTERKRLEAAMQQQAEELAEANRLKDEFVANLSHELRTPLNAIVGWSRLLMGGNLDAAATRHAVEVIERNARIQTDLVSDVLDISRVVNGKLQLNTRPVDVRECLQAALDVIRPAADARRIAIERHGDARAVVNGDPDRLQQVFWNLFSNAVKFTPDGGRVDVRLSVAPGAVTVTVEDTGIGIRPEFLGFVFDRFRQADASASKRHAGVGLGLSIAKHLVELHGGRVSAASEGEGRGAVFTVRLPLLSASEL
jgi:PAS domain S-box-containing protein